MIYSTHPTIIIPTITTPFIYFWNRFSSLFLYSLYFSTNFSLFPLFMLYEPCHHKYQSWTTYSQVVSIMLYSLIVLRLGQLELSSDVILYTYKFLKSRVFIINNSTIVVVLQYIIIVIIIYIVAMTSK